MAKRTIIFRADGGPTIGMGHFTRTLALAEMLKEHFYCIFATQKPTEYQIGEIEKVCCQRIDLQNDNSHFNQFLSLLKGNEIVVLDNYYFDTDYQRAIRDTGCKLVCIDDVHDKHYVADIVINHAEGVFSEAFSKESYTKLLLGFKYALIRKEFRLPAKNFGKKKFACLVMMGGADPFGITNKIIDVLGQYEFNLPVAVVMGIAHDKYNNSSTDKFRFFDRQNAEQVAKLMSESDFGILPASTVAIEASAMRLPFICGYFVDNQKEIYKGIKELQLALCIHDLKKVSSEKLLTQINKISDIGLKSDLIKNQIKIIDNNSVGRFVKIFKQL